MRVILSKETLKQYNHLPQSEQSKIKKKLLSLEQSPNLGKKLAGELSEKRALRAWPYRIIYSVNDTEQRVGVSSILHRQRAYK